MWHLQKNAFVKAIWKIKLDSCLPLMSSCIALHTWRRAHKLSMHLGRTRRWHSATGLKHSISFIIFSIFICIQQSSAFESSRAHISTFCLHQKKTPPAIYLCPFNRCTYAFSLIHSLFSKHSCRSFCRIEICAHLI